MERDSIDLGKEGVFRLFRQYFIPTLFGMLCLSAVTTVDGIFVGHGVGSDGIAAVNLCVPIFMVFMGIGMMIGAGCSVVASIQLSRGSEKVARLNVSQALAFITIVTVIPSIFIMCFPTKAAFLLGSSEHLLPLVKDYLLWLTPSLVLDLWITVGLFIIRLDGRPNLAMICSVLTAIINVFLDWLFIFPFGWGVKGAALASSLSIVIGGLIVVVYLGWYANKLRLIRIKLSVMSMKLSIRNLGYQCKIGFAALLSEATLAVLMFTGNQAFMQYLGDDGVGAFGIACYYIPFVFMIGNAITQSAQPIISFNFGLGEKRRVRNTEQLALSTAVMCGLLVTAAFVFIPRLLIGLFVSPTVPAAIIAMKGFPLFAIGFIPFILNLTAIGYFQSVEKVWPATIFALLRGLILLVPAFIFIPRILDIPGIWIAMPISEIITVLLIGGYYFWNHNQKRAATLTISQ